MALPIQSAPTYRTLLPSSNEEVKYRPFLVKEQKLLILARESEDQRQQLESVKELITACTFGEIDANTIAAVDLEWLFLQIRSKSVGENITVNLKCSDTECKGTGEVHIDIEKVEVTGEASNEPIMITDSVGVNLKLLTVDGVQDLFGKSQDEQIIGVLKASIARIFDNEQIFERVDISDSDLNDFIDNLTIDQLAKLTDWFEKSPKISFDASYKCNICDKQSTRRLEGIQSFF